jgi:ribonuclease E
MKKEMLINVLQPEECRIAIVEDGVLEELYVERTSHESYVGNIYKGRIVNIEPSIQAAFVDFGVGRNGFLHVSDVEPTYYRHLEQRFPDESSRGPNRRPARPTHRNEREPGPAIAAPVDDAAFEPRPIDSTPAPAEDIEPDRHQGRGRRRSRRSRSPAEEPPRSEFEDSENYTHDPGPEEKTCQDGPSGEDKPSERFMDSAERRTEEDDEQSSSDQVSDSEIMFPRNESAEVSEMPAAMGAGEKAVAWEEHDRPTPERESGGYDRPAVAGEPASEGDRRRPDRRPRDGRYGSPRGGRRGMGRSGLGRPKPPIQEIFRRGQEVLVQVIKEGIGTKGPTLSTYISIAGRYLVLMPGLNRIGVSRKIDDDEQRRRLREILNELQPPRGLGFIIRTAGLDRTKKELQRDLAYLSRLWQVVVRRIRKLKGPAEIYQESDMITRTIRDTFTSEIDTIWVDEPGAFEHAQEFLQIVMPRYANRIKLYAEPQPLFHRYGIEEEIARIQCRHIPLPNGGSIVIEQTEALVAIDVNSGNFRADNNAEATAFQMNLVAAKEIARQLRLRDLGGVIVNDFIDMRDEKHRRAVERALRDAVKRDRARTKILRISAFGIIEMTRQRIRPSLKRSVYQDCPHCHGGGQVKTCESMSIDVMRMLQLAAHQNNVSRIHVSVAEDVANYLLNRKRNEINRLEESATIQVHVTPAIAAAPEWLEFICYDNNGNEIKLFPRDEPILGRRR